VLAWNREAAARGAYTWVNLATLSKSQPGSTLLRDVVTDLKSGEGAGAIGMWKGADEPFWAKTPAEQLRYAYCLSTSRGPETWCGGDEPVDFDHLWVTIQAPRGTAEDLDDYTEVTDIHGVDHYPVTWADRFDPDLHEVGEWTDTIASVTPSHAVWTTLQVCASGSDNDQTGEFVLPTREQERYMIYDSIINGARSLAFYGGNIFRCWDERDASLAWNWRFWDGVLEQLVREINAVSPIAPALVNPETTTVLASNDPDTHVISRTGATSDELWVIAARQGQDTSAKPVTISGLPAWATTGTVYTEGRSVTASGGSLTDDFARWGVHVYHFRNEPPPPPPPPAPPPAPPPPAPPAPPPPPSEPTSTPLPVRKLLISRGLSSTTARAGRTFSARLRVVNAGAPVIVRCSARVGRSPLRPVSKRWSRGFATCTWRLPRTARGKLLRASVRVHSRGQTLARGLTRRVRR